LYLNGIDADNAKAIQEICTRNDKTISIQQLAQWTYVEQHEDRPDRMHLLVYSEGRPFVKKSSDQGRLGDKLDANEVPAIEVKGPGAIFYVSPSVHKNGYPYRIIGTNIPCLSNSFENDINNILKKYNIAYLLDDGNGIGGNGAPTNKIAIEELFKEDFMVYKDHNRHEALLRVMESLITRNKGILSLEQIKRLCNEWNNKHCVPPLDNTEFEKQWKCATKFIGKNNNNNNSDGSSSGAAEDDNNKDKKSKTEILLEITDSLLEEYTFKTMCDTEEIYYYDSERGIYAVGGENIIKARAEEMEPGLSNHQINEIIGHIIRRTYVDRREFDGDRDIINVKNGLLNIHTRELKEHNPEYLSLIQVPRIYDANARCPNIIKFWREVQNKNGLLLSKMFGYLLLKDCRYQTAFMFVGEGDNGKSVMLDLIEDFVGEENCSNIMLQDLATDKFMAAQLYNKLVNTYADISNNALVKTDRFKTLTAVDRIYARNIYQKPFPFRNFAKLIFSANEIPETFDSTYGYFKRWTILMFDRQFKRKMQDTRLRSKLTTEQELSGLLNIALAGLAKLIADNEFHSKDIETIKAEYERGATLVNNFVDEQCLVGQPSYYMVDYELRQAYYTYCKEKKNNAVPLSDGKFDGILEKTYGVIKDRLMVDKKKKQCYVGILTRAKFDELNTLELEKRRQSTL
jgi:P4 family phage/plasmid primase-like protien